MSKLNGSKWKPKIGEFLPQLLEMYIEKLQVQKLRQNLKKYRRFVAIVKNKFWIYKKKLENLIKIWGDFRKFEENLEEIILEKLFEELRKKLEIIMYCEDIFMKIWITQNFEKF